MSNTAHLLIVIIAESATVLLAAQGFLLMDHRKKAPTVKKGIDGRRSMSPNGLYVWLVAIYRRSLQDLKMAILGGDS